MEYLIVKWVHVVASALLFGTGVGSAFYLLFASLRREPAVVAFVARWVVIADWLFTATTMVVQPVTGLYLARSMRLPLTSGWVWWSIVLFVVAGACWLPVIWLQMRMRDLAADAAARGEGLPNAYWRAFRYWILLGTPALLSFIVIFYLMVAKPF